MDMESVRYNYCIWLVSLEYANDRYKHRYNWVHSQSGSETSTAMVYKFPDLVELAIL